MINQIITAWNRLSNLGLDADLSGFERAYFRLQNQITFISLLISFLYFILSLIFGNTPIGLQLSFLAFFVMLICIILASKGKHHFVRHLIAHSMLSIVLFGKMQGLVDIRGYYIMIPTSIGVYLTAVNREALYYNFLFAGVITFGTFLLMRTGFEPDKDYIFNLILLLLCIYIPWGLIQRFRIELIESRNTVAHQKQELELKSKDLERSNQELQQFAYAASHDLQEPLRTVSNFVQMLEEEAGEKLSEEEKEYIHYVVDGTTRMSVLIDALLQYAQVGKTQIQLKSIAPKTIIDSKLQDLSLKIEESNAEIVVSNLPKLIDCEPNQLSIVFYNLINNGLKFNKSPRPKITIEGKEEANQFLFKVSDNGIGIDPKNHQKIFEVFKRLHRKEVYKGTGIGLALVKRIIEKHHGKIWIESELRQGTTFYFTIPKK